LIASAYAAEENVEVKEAYFAGGMMPWQAPQSNYNAQGYAVDYSEIRKS
jgi:hypothetical protein